MSRPAPCPFCSDNHVLDSVMACGCWWERCSSFGDILVQCPRHKAGAVYEGSEPLTQAEAERFVQVLRDAGFEAREIGPERGQA